MTRKEQREQIARRLKPYPHRIPVFTSTHAIPERLFDYDENLFVALNAKTQRYEIHSLFNKGNTFCFSVAYDELDARVIDTVRKSNIRVRKWQEIVSEVDQHNEALEREAACRRRDEIGDLAERIHKPLRQYAYS